MIPQQYEDFFGPAATNIFNSNIGLEDVSNVGIAKPDSQTAFEDALGREVVNMYDYYDAFRTPRKTDVCEELGYTAPDGTLATEGWISVSAQSRLMRKRFTRRRKSSVPAFGTSAILA